jgi:predicted Rossmann fold nucleotide-binding protein DprA/Smf involved in DNA uptake
MEEEQMYPMPIEHRTMDTPIHWIWLQRNDTLSTAEKKRLLDSHGSPEAVYRSIPAAFGVSESWQVEPACTLAQAAKEYDRMKRHAIDILPYTDHHYRRVVAEDRFAPLLFYHRGPLPDPTRPVVQIITDSCSPFELKHILLHYRRKGFVIAVLVGRQTDATLLGTIIDCSEQVLLFCGGCQEKWYPDHLEPLLAQVETHVTLLNCDVHGTLPAAFHAVRMSRLLSLWCDVSRMVGRVDSTTSRAALWYANEAHRPVCPHRSPLASSKGMHTPISSAPIGSASLELCKPIIGLLKFVALSTRELSEVLEVDETIVLGLLIDMELCGSVVSTRKGRWKSRI